MRASLIMWVMGSNMCNFVSCLQHCPFCQIYRKWRPNQLCSSPWPMVNDHVCQIFWVKPLVHASATLISPVVGISPSRSQGLSPRPTPASCQMPEKWAGWPSHGISILRQPCHQQMQPHSQTIFHPGAWKASKLQPSLNFEQIIPPPIAAPSMNCGKILSRFAIFGEYSIVPIFHNCILLLNSEHCNSNLGQIPG